MCRGPFFVKNCGVSFAKKSVFFRLESKPFKMDACSQTAYLACYKGEQWPMIGRAD
jgi:hypothetical protein